MSSTNISTNMSKVTDIILDNDQSTFHINNCNVSIVNAIRRTILSDIDTVVIRTTPYEKNDADFIINTTRMHNEMLKHRLSCIPIHIKDTSINLDNYIVECHEKNNTDTIFNVTTEHFKIKNIDTDKYLSKTETSRIFPKDSTTGDYILFTKLRPRLSDTIPGEEIHFKAKLSIGNASEDSTFNVVSTCSYSFNPDPIVQDKVWNEYKKQLVSKGYNQEEIISEKKNWYLNEGKRIYKKDSFKFVIKTIGVFENNTIIKKACSIINQQLQNIINQSKEQQIEINNAVTMMSSYDIVLHNIDYTIGKIIEYALYNKYFGEDNVFNFVGFNKVHPHDKFSIIRLSFNDKTKDKNTIYAYISDACNDLIKEFNNIKSFF